jgi:hypothetical protein
MAAHAPRMPHVFFAQMGWPDPTRPEYQLTRPMWLTRIMMMSSSCNCGVNMHSCMTRMTSTWCNCDVSMHSRHAMSAPSHLTCQHNGTHPPHHQPRAELESSHELRYRIQCSWSYMQLDLRLNLGRLLGQNCFDQSLDVGNVMWTI